MYRETKNYRGLIFYIKTDIPYLVAVFAKTVARLGGMVVTNNFPGESAVADGWVLVKKEEGQEKNPDTWVSGKAQITVESTTPVYTMVNITLTSPRNYVWKNEEAMRKLFIASRKSRRSLSTAFGLGRASRAFSRKLKANGAYMTEDATSLSQLVADM